MNSSSTRSLAKLALIRIAYLAFAISTTFIGLATRKTPELFPAFIATYGGDTLWALLIFILLRMIMLRRPIWQTAAITYFFAIIIECSQLYQADWIIRWRQTFLGQMILGQGFLWSDFISYATGILLGCLLAYLVEKRNGQNRNLR